MLHEPHIIKTDRQGQSLIGILSNSASTTNREMMSRIRDIVDGNPHMFHYEFEDVGTISEGLKMMAEAGVSLLVINGGDGTIQATMSCIINNKPFATPPAIAVLPGGKTNMIARDLGAHQGPDKMLKKLINLVRSGKIEKRIVQRSLIGLDMHDGMPVRYGMFFGAAAIVKGILWSRDHVHKNGIPTRLGHAVAISRIVFGAAFSNKKSPLTSAAAKITLDDDECFDGTFNLIIVTTLSRLLVGLKPFGRDGKGALQLSVIRSGPAIMRRSLLAFLTGRYTKAKIDGLYTRTANKMTIACPDAITLDGELYTPKPDVPIDLLGDHSLRFVHF